VAGELMTIKFFGQFLLEKGVVNKKQLLESVDYQKKINVKLGTLAIDKGYLNYKQVEKIVDLQRKKNKFFSELALEENFLTKSQLDDLLKLQKTDRVYLGEALVKKKFLTLKELEENLREYKEMQKKSMEAMIDSLNNIEDTKHLNIVITVTLNLFRRIIGLSGKIGGCQREHLSPKNFCFGIRQKIYGEISGFFLLNLSEDMFFIIASKMLSEKTNEISDITIDAVKEFVNTVSGNICASLSQESMVTEALPPVYFDYREGHTDISEKGLKIETTSVIPVIFPEDIVELCFLEVKD
jgi:CheY-specific phosphatase CheX